MQKPQILIVSLKSVCIYIFFYFLIYSTVFCSPLQILVLELNDETAEQTVEAKVVDLLQGQEGFRWKVRSFRTVTAKTNTLLMIYL